MAGELVFSVLPTYYDYVEYYVPRLGMYHFFSCPIRLKMQQISFPLARPDSGLRRDSLCTRIFIRNVINAQIISNSIRGIFDMDTSVNNISGWIHSLCTPYALSISLTISFPCQHSSICMSMMKCCSEQHVDTSLRYPLV